MIKGIFTAGRSLGHRLKNIDIVANNIANINTIGYKREVPFSEYLRESGQSIIKKITDFNQGELALTSNPFDLSISGTGFFVLKDEDGNVELTRDGRFKLSEDGHLVNAEGKKVQCKNGDISLEETLLKTNSMVSISSSGEIKIGENVLDRILVYKVENAGFLERKEAAAFVLNGESYTAATEEDYKISQGFLEQSNTNPILEMEFMIQLNKEFETTQKVMSALDQSLGEANQIGKI